MQGGEIAQQPQHVVARGEAADEIEVGAFPVILQQDVQRPLRVERRQEFGATGALHQGLRLQHALRQAQMGHGPLADGREHPAVHHAGSIGLGGRPTGHRAVDA